jgi:hypothetical protein
MSEDIEDFDREERAFAEALRKDAPVESFRPLDADAIKAAARPARSGRSRWLRGMAAAAVLVVGVGIGTALLPHVGVGSSSSVPAEPAGGYAAGGAVPEAASDRASAAVYPDKAGPVPGVWSSTAQAILTPRSNAAGAWMNDEFYLVGGQSDAPCPPGADCMASTRLLRDGAAYNPLTDTWRRIADAPVALSEGEPVAVGGRLYFQRGYGSEVAIYAYDTTSDSWSQPPSPAGGGVLVAFGDRLASVAWSTEEAGTYDELFDPTSGQWTRLPADPLKASYERTLVWVGGRALLFAKDVRTQSSDKAPVFRVAELNLGTGKWRQLPDSKVVGVAGRAVGDVVVFPEQGSYDGGEVDNWGRNYPAGGIYDPATGKWSALPGPVRPDSGGLSFTRTAVAGPLLLTDGRVLDPAARRWTAVPEPPDGNLLGQTVVASADGILVFGGWDGSAATNRTFYLPLR